MCLCCGYPLWAAIVCLYNGGRGIARSRLRVWRATVNVTGGSADHASPLPFAGLPASLSVWMSHGDRVERLPDGFLSIAHSENSPLAAVADESRKIYGIQFHPEVVHTPQGAALLANFVKRICECEGD